MASAASGDASPRDRISFFDSRNSVPLLSGFVLGPIMSDFRNLSAGTLPVLSQSRMAPHISARLLPHMIWFLALLPKLTPLILYRCSFSRSTTPAPSPPSSMTVSAGLYSSMASMTWPTTSIVSAPRSRLMSMMSRPCRTAMTVASDPKRAGSTPMTMGAVSSFCRGRFMASSIRLTGINWSSPSDGN